MTIHAFIYRKSNEEERSKSYIYKEEDANQIIPNLNKKYQLSPNASEKGESKNPDCSYFQNPLSTPKPKNCMVPSTVENNSASETKEDHGKPGIQPSLIVPQHLPTRESYNAASRMQRATLASNYGITPVEIEGRGFNITMVLQSSVKE